MFITFATRLWMLIKRWRSRAKAKSAPRKELPKLDSVYAVSSYVNHGLTYTGDPILGGLDDFYQHPEYLQYCIENKITPPVDCDDYSVFACALLKGIPDTNPQMVVIVIDKVSTILKLACSSLLKLKVPYFPFHEGCLVKVGDRLWFIDTNGLWNIKDESELLATFGQAWGFAFKIIPTRYPF